MREWREAREQGWADMFGRAVLLVGGMGLALVAGAFAVILVTGPQAFVSRGLPAEVVQPASAIDVRESARSLSIAPVPASEVASATLVPALTVELQSETGRAPAAAATPELSALVTPLPTGAPTEAPNQATTADDLWPATLSTLDPIWGADTSGTVAVLDDFLARFPDYGPAQEKQYAALVAYGQSLAAHGDVDNARMQLMRAHDLLPDRGEAPVMLQALEEVAAEDADAPAQSAASDPDPGAPEMTDPQVAPPVPDTVNRAPAPQTRAPISTPVPRAAVPQNQAPAQPRPTPTKVPFLPPGG